MRVLVTGGGGQLARALTQSRPPEIELEAPSRAELDICDTSRLASELDEFKPDLIINTAAYTAVDRAEREPHKANQVNATAVGQLASLCADRDIRIIHLSTDYVFPGTADRSHKPGDQTRPVNQYGKSKLKGEELLLASGADCLIIRTGWLYAPWGHNFLTSMYKLMVKKLKLQIISDQTGTPTSVLDLAPAVWQFAARKRQEKDIEKEPERIWHWTNSGEATWFEFAFAIRKALMAKGLLEYPPSLEKISSMDWAAQHEGIAHRPHYSVLDSTDSYQRLGKTAEDWHDALQRVVDKL
jgi:dTDP-4-dehydrorhamnose reductase